MSITDGRKAPITQTNTIACLWDKGYRRQDVFRGRRYHTGRPDSIGAREINHYSGPWAVGRSSRESAKVSGAGCRLSHLSARPNKPSSKRFRRRVACPGRRKAAGESGRSFAGHERGREHEASHPDNFAFGRETNRLNTALAGGGDCSRRAPHQTGGNARSARQGRASPHPVEKNTDRPARQGGRTS